jgi:PleD family two-component response regulator
VLLIDDQPIIGEAVRRMIAGEPDIDFHYLQNPLQAIQTAHSVRPTVILQDLVMPEVDGLDLVTQLRAQDFTREIPMIVLSTKEEPKTKAEAFTLGASDYLVKDTRFWVVRPRISAAGTSRRASRGRPRAWGEINDRKVSGSNHRNQSSRLGAHDALPG